MTTKGGSSTISGVDFEAWFVAFKLVDVFFDENLTAKPQAQTYFDIKSEDLVIASIDDLFIYSDKKYEFYNIKSKAPNIDKWNFSELKNQKVLSQLKNQFLKSPNAILYFVSQSPCPLFQEILSLGSSCKSRYELENKLQSKTRIKDWDKLKAELDFSDAELINFANQVKFKHIIDIEELQKLILRQFSQTVTYKDYVPYSLHQLAINAGKMNREITKSDILSHFEKDNIHLKSHTNHQKLLNNIITASSTLSSIPINFIDDVHLNRKEVDLISNWIQKSLSPKEDSIATVTGNAGCGKTVILYDLFCKLREMNIPVLGIKTDLFVFNTIKSISDELNLTDGLIETVATIAESHKKVVVLFDQIDALSLSLSVDRNILNMYTRLIKQLSYIKNLRIIISCRTFDIKYDPLLQSLEQKNNFEVRELSDEEVGKVLSHFNITLSQVTKSLLSLLKIALHLKIFCDIYHKDIDLKSITTIQDLYDKLWEKHILSISKKDLKDIVLEAIVIVTDRIDITKSLTIPLALLDRVDEGKKYLLSHSILIHHQNKIQFFHQSFFDYCYARNFLNKHNSLLKVVLNQHQGLFIRPQIKNVLAYLRGSDHHTYLHELYDFLTNEKVRFHVWLLVVNQLAYIEDPTDDEWQVILPMLKSNDNFKKHFIQSLNSLKWLKKLIYSGYFKSMLISDDENLVNIIVLKLKMLINNFTDTIIDFLYNFPDIKKKDDHISSILYRLEHWENEKSVQLFKNYLPTFRKLDKMFYYHFLNDILKDNKEVILKIFIEDFDAKLDEIYTNEDFDSREFLEREEVEIIESLLNCQLETVFPIIFDRFKKLIYKTKCLSSENFFHDLAFYSQDSFDDDLYNHWRAFTLISSKLQEIANINKLLFIETTKEIKNTYSFTLLKLLLRGYSANPEFYIDESFEFLSKKDILENMTGINSGGYELRILLQKVYPSLSIKQKEKIHKLILTIAPKWEKKKGSQSYRGKTQYKLLCAIPEKERIRNKELQKRFQESFRKFGKHEENPPETSGVFCVGPPLTDSAYKKMTLDQWLQSFRKYDESTDWDRPRESVDKGGLVEHYRMFSEQVSRQPEKYFNFILRLGEQKDIPLQYLGAGIEGLTKAKYDPNKLKVLLLKYYRFDHNMLRKRIISAIDYLDSEDHLDLQLISILSFYALNDIDPEKELWDSKVTGGTAYYGGDPLGYGINTVRGTATYRLVAHGFKTSFPDKIFEILEKIADDKSITVRCCLIENLRGIIKWDKKRTYSLFLKVTNDLHPKIIKHSLNCLTYLMKPVNFKEIFPHIKVAMSMDEKIQNYSVKYYVGQILMWFYIKDFPESGALLEKGFELSDEIKAGAIDFAARNLTSSDTNISKKAKNIYIRFLYENSEKIANVYSWSFQYFKPEDFSSIYSVLEMYCTSTISKTKSNDFFDYLIKCLSYEPQKCLDLIKHYKKFGSFNFQTSYILDEPIKVLIGAYCKLYDKTYQELAMDIFDNMLQEEGYKEEALKVLSKQDRY